MPSRRRLDLLAALVLTGLAGCAPSSRPPARPPQISHPLPQPPAAAVEAAVPVLEARGIEVVSADPATGMVRGRASDLDETGWAQCPSVRIQDTDGKRLRIAEPGAIDLDLRLVLTPAGQGSSLVVRPDFERTYLDSFRFSEFQRRCPSTGALEREIASALAAARPS
jgi:hypothetical protein